MSTIIQYMRIIGGVNKETMLTTWGADEYNLQHSQLLHHILDPTRYNEIMLKIWESDYNSIKLIVEFVIQVRGGILLKEFGLVQNAFVQP